MKKLHHFIMAVKGFVGQFETSCLFSARQWLKGCFEDQSGLAYRLAWHQAG
jgi:hypothetical protein